MKKLMIAAAIVCAAAFAQAATVDWTVNGSVFDYNTFQGVQGTMAFYLASDTDFANPLADSPLALDPDTGDFTGTVTGTDQTGWVARLTVSNFDEGGSWYKDYAFTMDTVTHPGAPSATEYLSNLSAEVAGNFADIDLSASAASQGYTAAAVPEPTSGLLLLLGVAGLALKRRRA